VPISGAALSPTARALQLLTDAEITERLADLKMLPANAIATLTHPKEVGLRSLRAKLFCKGISNRRYSILTSFPPNGIFSVHVRYHVGRRKPITLVRCDCGDAPHTNQIEKRTREPKDRWFIPAGAPHVHWLTERYQQSQWKDTSFATVTNEYNCFHSAVEHVCYSYGFYFRDDQYKSRFPLFRGLQP